VLAELAERDAAGEVAAIYAAIRRLWAVPYVSSLQRHLAARPGWLEWVWAALHPVFADGRAQTAAWQAVALVDVPRLAPIARDALRVWGVDAAGEATIRAVCESFVRVSPVNLVLSGLLRRLLDGERPQAKTRGGGAWTPPPSLPPLPALADIGALSPFERSVLLSLGTQVGAEPFVPGLYRMLAGWPAFLAHLATALRPVMEDPAAHAAYARVNAAIDARIPALFAELPALPAEPPAPPAADVPGVRAALDAYRRTSPEMVVVGRVIERALPALTGA
jgi:Halocarboxylic acid dehydrogenase DehI